MCETLISELYVLIDWILTACEGGVGYKVTSFRPLTWKGSQAVQMPLWLQCLYSAILSTLL